MIVLRKFASSQSHLGSGDLLLRPKEYFCVEGNDEEWFDDDYGEEIPRPYNAMILLTFDEVPGAETLSPQEYAKIHGAKAIDWIRSPAWNARVYIINRRTMEMRATNGANFVSSVQSLRWAATLAVRHCGYEVTVEV